ncbi:50S ribosomal L9 C-terminal domain-containing protein, partial [Lutibacter sp.]
GQEVDKKYIKVEGGTIKRLGKYNVSIRLHREVIFELPIEVIAEAK